MTKAFENYTLLAGSHGRRGSLWKGPDHLLVVEGSGLLFAFSEQYRRIDYANIQALALVRTPRHAWLIAAFGVPALLCVIGLIATLDRAVGFSIAFGIPLAVLLTFLIVHLVKGRTVRCSLQTAVQQLRLRPLTREGKAQRVLDELAQLCRQHQGEAPARDLAAVPVPPAVTAPPTGGRPLWRGSPAAIAAGGAVLLWGLIFAGELFVSGIGYLILDGTAGMLATGAVIIALVVALRHRSPIGLLIALWVSLGVGLLTGFMSMVAVGVAGARLDHLGRASGPVDAFVHLGDIALADTHGLGWLVVGLGAFIALLGVAMLVHGPRKGTPAPGASPLPPIVSNPGPPS